MQRLSRTPEPRELKLTQFDKALGYMRGRGQGQSWWHDLPGLEAWQLTATRKEREACEGLQPHDLYS